MAFLGRSLFLGFKPMCLVIDYFAPFLRFEHTLFLVFMFYSEQNINSMISCDAYYFHLSISTVTGGIAVAN